MYLSQLNCTRNCSGNRHYLRPRLTSKSHSAQPEKLTKHFRAQLMPHLLFIPLQYCIFFLLFFSIDLWLVNCMVTDTNCFGYMYIAAYTRTNIHIWVSRPRNGDCMPCRADKMILQCVYVLT